MPPKTRIAGDPSAASVVLLSGKETFLIERALERVLQVARQEEPTTERREVRAGSDSSDALSAFADAMAPTLFGDAAVVLVHDADQFEDEGQKQLLDAVNALPQGMRLLIHHPASVKAKKLLDTLRKHPAVVEVECQPLRYRAVDEFINREFGNRGRKVTSEAVNALRISVGDDLRSLASAVAQLCSDIPDVAIDAGHVALYHSGVADVPGYEVSDAVLNGDPDQLVRRMRWALENDGNATPAITGATANGLRQLVRYVEARRMPDPEAARVVGVPPFKLKDLATALRRWNPDQLARAARLLAAADLAAKGQTPQGTGLENAQRHHAVESALLEIADR